jgi:hypothetical protein
VPLVVVVLFLSLIHIPTTKNSLFFQEVRSQAEQAPVYSADYSAQPGALERLLQRRLEAARRFEDGKRGYATWLFDMNWRSLLPWVGSLPMIRNHAQVVDQTAHFTEPGVNAPLRQLLSSSVWASPPGPAGAARIEPLRQECEGVADERPVHGTLFVDAAGGSGRGLLVVRNDRDVAFYPARKDGTGCKLGQRVLSVPGMFDPRVVVDATATYVAVAVSRGRESDRSVTLSRLVWHSDEAATELAAELATVSVLVGPWVDKVRKLTEENPVVARASWREPTGVRLDFGAEAWRVVAESAQPLKPELQGSLLAMAPSPQDSLCHDLPQRMMGKERSDANLAVVKMEVFEHADTPECFVLLRGTPPPDLVRVLGASNDRFEGEKVLVFGRSAPALDDPAGMPPLLAVLSFGPARAGRRVYLGRAGDLEGWIVLGAAGDQGPVLHGAPWSTSALIRIGESILPPSDLAQAGFRRVSALPGSRSGTQ